jgi:hypothetical protein
MKIRNGFVSNSSSSSFILVYDKTKVYNTPDEIFNFLTARYQDRPSILPIFDGGDYCEGRDMFELPADYEELIRKFPDEFKAVSGGMGVKVYGKAKLFHDAEERSWGKPNIDMSDVPYVEITAQDLNEYAKADCSEETKKKFEASSRYYRELEEREKEANERENLKAIDIAKEQLIEKGSKAEDIESDRVFVDYHTTDNDENDFVATYFTNDYSDDETYLLDNRADLSRPFVLLYDDLLTDREEIVSYLKGLKNVEDFKPIIFWTNPIKNFIRASEDIGYDGIYVDFYEVGEEERDIILKNYSNNNRQFYLATEARVLLDNSGDIKGSTSYMLGYGRPILVKAGQDLIDFEKNFKNEFEVWEP